MYEVEATINDSPGFSDMVTDQEEFDANQDAFTQLVERKVWERLCIAPHILALTSTFVAG